MSAEPRFPGSVSDTRPTIDDVRLALARLQGRSALIRHRAQRTASPNRANLLASLEQVEEQIQVLTELLDAIEQATAG